MRDVITLIGAGALALVILLLGACSRTRDGGDLFVEHEVTVAGSDGPQSETTVLKFHATQTYNYPAGGAGWGGIGVTMNGQVIRVTSGGNDFYFLFSRPATFTPAARQWELIKKYFGIPNYTEDDSWIAVWRNLGASETVVDLAIDDYPPIAVIATGQYANDARLVDLETARRLGLDVRRYRMKIVAGPEASQSRAKFKFRPPVKDRFGRVQVVQDEIYPEYFEAVNAQP